MGFFDKLKKSAEEVEEKPIPEKTEKKKKEAKLRAEKIKIQPDVPKAAVVSKKEEKNEPITQGELAIDVYETDEDFVIRSTIAGVKAEDLDISIENDIVTIKGSRQKQTEEKTKKYYYQECYWGEFSRQVILPEEVDGSKAEASIKDGILTLKIPKVIRIQKRKITIKQED
ncbi:MAG: Hsp20/alpha crystallin family protein [Candidatus Nealsonbacteria bacterium]|nr:Hsp20/alpha crystallin family protein [Candidatus Nealsonbacteria bacterium]